MLDAQKVVHHFEPLCPGRVVGSANVHDLLVLSVGVIPQEVNDGDNSGGGNVES